MRTAAFYRTTPGGASLCSGRALVTITGAVQAPGVYELAFGTPMSDLLAAASGPVEPLQALRGLGDSLAIYEIP